MNKSNYVRRSKLVELENTLWLDNPNLSPTAVREKVTNLVTRYGYTRTKIAVEQGYLF